MAIPVYLWLEDDGGAPVKGSVDANDNIINDSKVSRLSVAIKKYLGKR